MGLKETWGDTTDENDPLNWWFVCCYRGKNIQLLSENPISKRTQASFIEQCRLAQMYNVQVVKIAVIQVTVAVVEATAIKL